ADVQLTLHEIDAHAIVKSDGAREPAALVGVVEAMVLRQLDAVLVACAAQQPGAGVAHVCEREGVAAQHQRGQRRHRGAAFADLPGALQAEVADLDVEAHVVGDPRKPAPRAAWAVILTQDSTTWSNTMRRKRATHQNWHLPC